MFCLQIKAEYNSAIKSLETNILKLKQKLQKQLEINRNLSICKSETKKKFEILEEKYNNLLSEQKISLLNLRKSEISLKEAKSRLSDMMREKNDLETCLDRSNATAREQITRENEALNKVQDALLIAESALKEKHEALEREKAIKEECDLLASTIGQVMEDAAERVEKEMSTVKAQYNERINNLNLIVENLKISLHAQSERANLAESRVQNLENQLKNLVKTNSQLDADLQVASQTIVSTY